MSALEPSEEPEESEEIEDDIGLAGKACGWSPVGSDDDDRTPGIVRGSRREPEEHARIIIEVTEDGVKKLIDADRSRVEVL